MRFLSFFGKPVLISILFSLGGVRSFGSVTYRELNFLGERRSGEVKVSDMSF